MRLATDNKREPSSPLLILFISHVRSSCQNHRHHRRFRQCPRGFLLSGGKIGAIIQPFEVLIIGGAALGAFLQANPGSTFMVVLKKAPKMFSNRFTQTYYLEVLGMLYEILNKSRREGMMAIEADIEDPRPVPSSASTPAC